jgi:hypothetical protein
MKRIIIMIGMGIFTLVCSTDMLAQESRAKQVMDKIRKGVDPAAMAGIYDYEAEAAIKAVKIRKAAKKSEAAAIIEKYNDGLASLKTGNIGLLAGLGTSIAGIVRDKDYGMLLGARSDYKNSVGKIRVKQLAMHDAMEEELFEVLSRRQKRKWHKYQEQRRMEAASTFDMGDLSLFLGL